MSLTGILPLDKPVGVRSTSCVEAARRALGGKIKVGHGGTLDSTASGLLLLLIGPATRLSNYIMEMPKRYETTLQFGAETTTDDASGEIKSSADAGCVTDSSIDGLIPAFIGWRMQEPPQISAVHVGGERAHKLSRGGMDLSIKPKPVFIRKIERLGSVSQGCVQLAISCGKGTYVRSLARDFGRRLGCGAHVRTLRRLSSGPFFAADALPARELADMEAGELEKYIQPLSSLGGVSARYAADESERKKLLNGRTQMLGQLRRNNFGQFNNNLKHIIITIDGIFSVCRAERNGDSFELFPETNIFYGGRNSE